MMTIEELNELPDERLRVMCAEALGATKIHESAVRASFGDGCGDGLCGLFPGQSEYWDIPEYVTDLNAMHEAEKTLKGDEQPDYMEALGCNLSDAGWTCFWNEVCATARQRCIAFIAVKQTGEVEHE